LIYKNRVIPQPQRHKQQRVGWRCFCLLFILAKSMITVYASD